MANENYLMTIKDKVGTFQFPITPKFFPSLTLGWKRDGKTVVVTDSVPVEGWFSNNDQDALLVLWNRLRDISQSGAPTTFIFKKDPSGTEIYKFKKAHMQNLQSIDHDGGFVNHVNFSFNITEERGSTFPDLVDVTREDTTSKKQEISSGVKTVKHMFTRTVSATGEFGDLAPARKFVLDLKPSLKNLINEEIQEIHFDGRVIGTWTFETTDEDNPENKGIKLWNERVTRHPGQLTHRFYPTVARDFARKASVLIRGGMRESRINVSGHIESYDKDKIPSVQSLLHHYDGEAVGITGIVLESPSISGIYPVEFDVEDPKKVTLHAVDYSYSLLSGEVHPSEEKRPPDVRHVGNQG